ncbi:hypothetical protein DFJ63DRAFT_334511 [Scheffersomyces coipomensis]|uniref:uncharacterized protein n=1 Tax=Scheffersomyces coipomensis TaxID=1788519 RepID=UPI00315D8CFD
MSLDNETSISNQSSSSNKNPIVSNSSTGSAALNNASKVLIPNIKSDSNTTTITPSKPSTASASGVSILNPIISPKGSKDIEKLRKKRVHDEVDNNEESIIDEDDEIDSDEQGVVVDPEIEDYNHSLNPSSSSHFQARTNTPGSSSAAATATRSKLSTEDIKIILYLIIKIKPFKYIGDRSLSQTRKWEIVQAKYSQVKEQLKPSSSASPAPNSNLVVPTVRTLQRQLATAIKKALTRREESGSSDKVNTIEKPDDYYNYDFITIENSLSELENYVLELNELSENFKAGRLEAVSNPSAVITGTTSPVTTTSNTTALPTVSASTAAAVAVAAVSSSSSSPNAPKPKEQSYLNLKEVLESTSLIEIPPQTIAVPEEDPSDNLVSKFETLTNEISSIIDADDKQSLPFIKTLQGFANLNTLLKNHEDKVQNLNESLLNDLHSAFKNYKKKLNTIHLKFNQDKLNSFKSFTDFMIDSLNSTDPSSTSNEEVLKLLNSFKDSLK